MAERQGHGLMFESYLNDMMDAYEDDSNYTGEYDAYFTTDNGQRFVSVKNTSKRGEICMGDFERIINSTEPVIMFDGRHDSYVPMPDRIIVHYLPYGFSSLFADGQIEAVEGLVHKFKDYMFSEKNLDLEALRDEMGDPDITFNDREFDPYWRKRRIAFIQAYKKLFYDGADIWIHPRPKRDHKSQRRLQCAIPRGYVNQFFEKFAAFEMVFRNDGNISIYDYKKCFDPDRKYQQDEEMRNRGEEVEPSLYDGYDGHEYVFMQCDGEEYEDMEQRAWRWLEYLICIAL